MRPVEQPPRLIESAEFGPLLRRAARGEVSPERLMKVQRALEASLAAEVGAGAGELATHTGLGGKLALLLGLGIIASVGVWRETGFEEHPARVAIEAPAAPPEAPAPPRAAAHKPLGKARPPRVAPSKPEVPPAPVSALKAELELFHEAERLARAGRFNDALLVLAKLEALYPRGALTAEVVVSRAEYLLRAGREREAAAFIEARLLDASLSSRRAELSLILGDVRLRLGDCPAAVAAYQRALGLGLREEDAETARRGLRRCGP